VSLILRLEQVVTLALQLLSRNLHRLLNVQALGEDVKRVDLVQANTHTNEHNDTQRACTCELESQRVKHGPGNRELQLHDRKRALCSRLRTLLWLIAAAC
jgi:hypothetical protein